MQDVHLKRLEDLYMREETKEKNQIVRPVQLKYQRPVKLTPR